MPKQNMATYIGQVGRDEAAYWHWRVHNNGLHYDVFTTGPGHPLTIQVRAMMELPSQAGRQALRPSLLEEAQVAVLVAAGFAAHYRAMGIRLARTGGYNTESARAWCQQEGMSPIAIEWVMEGIESVLTPAL